MSYQLTKEEVRHQEVMQRLSARYPLLKEEEHITLVAKFQAGDKRAGDKLLAHNLRLVISIAKKNVGKGLDLGDLFQEGCIGFMKSLGKFDISKGFRLSTYATWWIRQAITRAIENKSKMIRIPSHKLQQANKVRWVYRQWLESRANGEHDDDDSFDKAAPNAKDLVELCGLTEEQIEESGRYLKDHLSLSSFSGSAKDAKTFSEDEGLTLEDYIGASPDDQPEEQIERSADRHYIESVLSHLSDEERSFVLLRFSFLDGVTRTKREMSNFTKLSPTENQRKEEEILAKLKGLIDLRKLNND
jgi:RNA polymerase primary sigma factor